VHALLEHLESAYGHRLDSFFRLPINKLMEIGAAIRLCYWEAIGFQGHQEAGLPSGQEALVSVFLSIDGFVESTNEPAPATESLADWCRAVPLSVQLTAFHVARLAWNGTSELGATIVLGEADEEELVNSLAELLWAVRHQLPKD